MTEKVLSGKCRGDYDRIFIYHVFSRVFTQYRISVDGSIAGSNFLAGNSDSVSNRGNGNRLGVLLYDSFDTNRYCMFKGRIQIIDTGNLIEQIV